MVRPLRVLVVEDSEDDTLLAIEELRKGGFDAVWERVELPQQMMGALGRGDWDVILCDYALPHFSGRAALAMYRQWGIDVPFILVSGMIGEEAAVEAMRAGAHDFVMKDKLFRLVPAIERELREAEIRRERRQAEAALRESERKYRSLAESMAEAQEIAQFGSWCWHVHGEWFEGSDETYRILGLVTQGERLTMARLTELVAPESRAALRDLMAQMAAGRAAGGEIAIGCPDGSRRYARMHGVPEGAPPRRVFGYLQDITEREALTREIQLLLESTYEGIYTTDAAGLCTLVNRAACSMLGFTQAELLGHDLHLIIHHHRADGSPYPLDECPIGIAATRTRPQHVIDEVLWRKDGTSFPVEILISPIIGESHDARGLVVSFTDVTEKRLLHDELERANRLSSLGRVAATMSHEFNNVLMGIQPFAELISRRSSDERLRSAAERITQSVERGRTVTRQLLRFTRPADPLKQTIGIEQMLSDCACELRPLMPRGIALDVSVSEPALTVTVDREQIAQVITNLVLNARDAMGETGGRITIGAERCTGDQRFSYGVVPDAHHFIHFYVADTGPGIQPDDLQRLFEPFFTTKKRGTGLGLPIAHQIVAQHDGHIFVESRPGGGTTAHFFLPTTAVAPAEVRAKPQLHGYRPRRVLLVEDEDGVAEGMKLLLEGEGMQVRVARNGGQALAALAIDEPEALILDVGLPDIDGVDLFNRMRPAHPALPVIFSSGHADRSRIEELTRRGPVRLLVKPYNLNALLQALDEVSAEELVPAE